MIFVTGDEKSDWMVRSENTALFPRFELIEEYQRSSEGQSFHIMKFSELLDFFDVKQNVVAEVKKEEDSLSESSQFRYHVLDDGRIERAWVSKQDNQPFIRWLASTYSNASIQATLEFPEIITEFDGGSRAGFQVFNSTRLDLLKNFEFIKEMEMLVNDYVSAQKFDTMIYVFIFGKRKESVDSLPSIMLKLARLHLTSCIVGYIDINREFVPIHVGIS
jgi:hypothetical protein